jgi:hypothetical protein
MKQAKNKVCAVNLKHPNLDVEHSARRTDNPGPRDSILSKAGIARLISRCKDSGPARTNRKQYGFDENRLSEDRAKLTALSNS